MLLLLPLLLLCRGFTRKEPYANHNFGFNWTPKAENWNGRIAMLGFTGMLLTEVRGIAVAAQQLGYHIKTNLNHCMAWVPDMPGGSWRQWLPAALQYPGNAHTAPECAVLRAWCGNA
jgi:hypothetical protein